MKKKKEIKRRKILYFVIILLIIINTFFITINYLIINKDINGKVILNDKYFNILFGDIYVENDNISVKLDKDNMSMSVNVKNLELLNDSELLYFDLINIGNENVSFDGSITNFDSNINSNDISVNINSEDNVIMGGESKRIYINYNKLKEYVFEKSYLKFNISIKFY